MDGEDAAGWGRKLIDNIRAERASLRFLDTLLEGLGQRANRFYQIPFGLWRAFVRP
jgi:hypothetical protein